MFNLVNKQYSMHKPVYEPGHNSSNDIRIYSLFFPGYH